MKATVRNTAALSDSARATTRPKKTHAITGLVLAMLLMIGVSFAAPAFAHADEADGTELVPPAVSLAETPRNGMATFVDTLESIINTDASRVYAAQVEAQMEAFEEADGSAVLQAAAENPLEDRSMQAAGEATESEAAAAAEPTQLYDVIQVNGTTIPYVDSHLTSTAPASTAGIWWGSDSTTDGQLGYFIGHNPGIFTPVLDLAQGSAVDVWDTDGNFREYHVVDLFDVPNTTYLEDMLPRINTHGESICLQTCIQGGAYYRIIVAA